MSPHRFPAPDLPRILFWHAAAEIIAAIPLEPAARILGRDPSFAAPDRERLACRDTEIVQRRVMPSRRQPGAVEPVEWKFVRAVGHVFPTENAEVEHFFRRELGRELRVEVPARGRRESVTVAF